MFVLLSLIVLITLVSLAPSFCSRLGKYPKLYIRKCGNFRHVLIFVNGTFNEILTREKLDMSNKKHAEILLVSHLVYMWQWLTSIHGITAIPQACQWSPIPKRLPGYGSPSREITEANTLVQRRHMEGQRHNYSK